MLGEEVARLCFIQNQVHLTYKTQLKMCRMMDEVIEDLDNTKV